MAIKNYVVIHGILRLSSDVVNPGEVVAMDEKQAEAFIRKDDGDGGVLVSESDFKEMISQIKAAEKTKTPLSATLRKLKQGMVSASSAVAAKAESFPEPKKLSAVAAKAESFPDEKPAPVETKKKD